VRQIVLDTETTGLEANLGHRIIEIGAVEIINRRLTGNHFHRYINPERNIDEGALEVHGINRAFLQDKPVFADVYQEFVNFISGAELVIHNAAFDVGFMDYEFKRIPGAPRTTEICQIKDSLALARSKHPGQKNNLDALCRRYEVDNSHRELHGALLDAEILADVYLLMTGGQTHLFGGSQGRENGAANAMAGPQRLAQEGLRVIRANADESAAHEAFLDMLKSSSGTPSVWRAASTDDL
jgi:DNA polymerase-3 subunit epsilon